MHPSGGHDLDVQFHGGKKHHQEENKPTDTAATLDDHPIYERAPPIGATYQAIFGRPTSCVMRIPSCGRFGCEERPTAEEGVHQRQNERRVVVCICKTICIDLIG